MLARVILGIGIDLCGAERIRRMLLDHGDCFLERTFTPAEAGHARRRRKGSEETLAGRFAAKEAVMKALGTGWAEGVGFLDIEVRSRPGGAPHVVLHGKAAERAAALGVAAWHVSITHAEGLAVALAVAEGA